jgi:hypothetical protein
MREHMDELIIIEQLITIIHEILKLTIVVNEWMRLIFSTFLKIE